jgi:hypothetical protein
MAKDVRKDEKKPVAGVCALQTRVSLSTLILRGISYPVLVSKYINFGVLT